MKQQIVFFDDRCPFCHRAVRHIVEIDEKKMFRFAPLRGETARTMLTGPQGLLAKANSIVLVEDSDSTFRKFWVRSHAMFRIYWLVGNGWGLVGMLSFLPKWVGNFFYNWLAAHRHQFTLDIPETPYPMDRHLP